MYPRFVIGDTLYDAYIIQKWGMGTGNSWLTRSWAASIEVINFAWWLYYNMQGLDLDQLVYNAPETSYMAENFEEHLLCVNDLLNLIAWSDIRVNKI